MNLKKSEAHEILQKYLQFKTDEGITLQSVYMLSGACMNVTWVHLVSEKRKESVRAKFDQIDSEDLYCIASDDIAPLTMKSILQSRPDRDEENEPKFPIRNFRHGVEKQLSITQFFASRPRPKLVRKQTKSPHLKADASSRNQSSMSRFLYKKQTFKPNQSWLDRLKLDFAMIESSIDIEMDKTNKNEAFDHYLDENQKATEDAGKDGEKTIKKKILLDGLMVDFSVLESSMEMDKTRVMTKPHENEAFNHYLDEEQKATEDTGQDGEKTIKKKNWLDGLKMDFAVLESSMEMERDKVRLMTKTSRKEAFDHDSDEDQETNEDSVEGGLTGLKFNFDGLESMEMIGFDRTFDEQFMNNDENCLNEAMDLFLETDLPIDFVNDWKTDTEGDDLLLSMCD